MKSVAERVKEARVSRGLTVEAVATGCGVSVSAVQMYESGARVPRDSIKIKMAKFFGVTVQDLFF